MALDEELLQALDAADAMKPEINKPQNTVDTKKSAAIVPSRDCSTVPENLKLLQPQSHTSSRAASIQESICVRAGDHKMPGWRDDCKDLAQRLLFSEDAEETEHPQKNPSQSNFAQNIGKEIKPVPPTDITTK